MATTSSPTARASSSCASTGSNPTLTLVRSVLVTPALVAAGVVALAFLLVSTLGLVVHSSRLGQSLAGVLEARERAPAPRRELPERQPVGFVFHPPRAPDPILYSSIQPHSYKYC